MSQHIELYLQRIAYHVPSPTLRREFQSNVQVYPHAGRGEKGEEKRRNIFAVPERKVSSIGSVGSDSCRELGLPLIAVRQQLLFVVQQLLPGLGGILSIGGLDDGVDGTRFYIMSVIP